MGLAAKHANASLCDRLGLSAKDRDVSSLVGMCYALVAEAKRDADVCAEASKSAYLCFSLDAAAVVADADIKANRSALACADECYFDYASRNNVSALFCERISNAGMRTGCYQNVANSLQDPAVCEKLQDSQQRGFCYSTVAATSRDSAVCDKVPASDVEVKENCYYYTYSCGKLSDVNLKEECYANNGECEKILNATLKQYCLGG